MKIIIAIFMMVVSQMAYSFEYEIEQPLLQGKSTPGHETLTSLALDCVAKFNAKDARPEKCLGDLDSIDKYITKKGVIIPSISSEEIAALSILDASSWPDDPTRQGSYYGAKAKINLLRECDNFWSFLGFEEYTDSIAGGLFCNSHLGVLQFFHSQASKPVLLNEGPESYLITRLKTLAWIRLNYEIIKDKKLLSKPYCDYFGALKNTQANAEMAEAFLPKKHGDGLLQCKNSYSLEWIYSNKCTNIVSSKGCTKVGNKADYQIVALGAIVHAIQDSYSLAHTKRGECSNGDNKPVSKLTCKPIEQYYAYAAQDGDKHGASDVLPIAIDSSCKSTSDVDDVVTATASAIWHAMNGKDTQELMDYLERSVFYDPYVTSNPPMRGPVAGGGMCYTKDS